MLRKFQNLVAISFVHTILFRLYTVLYCISYTLSGFDWDRKLQEKKLNKLITLQFLAISTLKYNKKYTGQLENYFTISYLKSNGYLKGYVTFATFVLKP